ncbi:MAG TPA: bifunctional phosphoglucose/phosphomannose isomerase, partial [Ignavibacteriaceae bacterium]|nr:bifunctional phosphoglucose/phosphomannose isomerase [Ignavibacteriaceae bacterium]
KTKKFRNIIVTGLGGSAISGDLVQNFLRDEMPLPFSVNRNYNLPLFADKNTLLIVSSYSGNTEETISVFEEGIKKKCGIVCITTGGKVEEMALKKKIPVVKMKPGFQPRFALGLSFFSLLKVLSGLGLISDQNETVERIKNLLMLKGKEYTRENNIAFNCAMQLIGFIPLIYSAADVTSAAGYRLKCQFNENSKLHAFHNVIPELNHNEIIGWETYSNKQLNAKLINILDETYHPQVKKRFEITTELAAKQGLDYMNIESEEDDFKIRLMDLIFLFDWITYYTAVLRGYDPSEIDNIHTLKERLS